MHLLTLQIQRAYLIHIFNSCFFSSDVSFKQNFQQNTRKSSFFFILKTPSVIIFYQLYPYNTFLNSIWLNYVVFNSVSMIMVYSKHSIVVHQRPCKNYLGLMAFLIKFVNSLKMSTF